MGYTEGDNPEDMEAKIGDMILSLPEPERKGISS